MPFECKKYHGECKARCCGTMPFKKEFWNREKFKAYREVKEVLKGKSKEGDVVIPLTDDAHCPFLKEDLSCAIYEIRPTLCRKFGDESHIMMTCPMQHADGEPRTEDEKDEFALNVELFHEGNIATGG